MEFKLDNLIGYSVMSLDVDEITTFVLVDRKSKKIFDFETKQLISDQRINEFVFNQLQINVPDMPAEVSGIYGYIETVKNKYIPIHAESTEHSRFKEMEEE